MYFADFWANFYDFFTAVLLPQMGIEDIPITCKIF